MLEPPLLMMQQQVDMKIHVHDRSQQHEESREKVKYLSPKMVNFQRKLTQCTKKRVNHYPYSNRTYVYRRILYNSGPSVPQSPKKVGCMALTRQKHQADMYQPTAVRQHNFKTFEKGKKNRSTTYAQLLYKSS